MATNIKSIKGITSELAAAIEYMKRGYYVSFSLDPLCPFDLVVTDDNGDSFLVDVKTESKRKTKVGTHGVGGRIYRRLTKEQKNMGVKLRYITWEELNGKDK
jgi:hypothetical protein